MAWITGFLASIGNRIADRIAEQVILLVRKRLQYGKIDDKAQLIKDELKSASSNAEKEAILDKVHDLVNSLDS